MSSNEEYLDSLLKAVAEGPQGNTENLSEENEAGLENTQAWDGISQNDLEQMLANVENSDIHETNLEEKMPEVYVEEGENEEKAFIDPGELFFGGEEEYVKEEGALGSEEDADKEFGSLFFEGEEEEEEASYVAGSDYLTDEASFAETDMSASTDNMEEDRIAEEDLSAPAGGAEEEDLIAAADSTEEEDLIAAADSTEEEDLIAAADSTEEEDLIAAADSTEEEDLIAAADSIEEAMPDELPMANLDDEGFKEINDLLASSSEDDEDMFAMLQEAENADEEVSDIGFFEEEEEETAEVEEVKEKKKKEKKKRKKTAVTEEETEGVEEGEVPVKEKKPGVFARFMNFLLEEDEDEEEKTGGGELAGDGDDLIIGEPSDENAAILEELDKEDAANKAQKKDKKKKKKGKKGKAEEAASEDAEGEEGEEGEEGPAKGKKAKKEKKRKEKREKSEEIPAEPTKKISAAKIEVTAVLCLSILAAVLLTIHLVPSAMEKGRAREAYYAKDYEKVVEGFYGEELSESEELMYERAYAVLRMQRKIDGYNNFMRMGKETEAVNQLIEGVVRYQEIYENGSIYNVSEEIDEIYQTITDALYNKYGITPERAEELYEMEDNFAYTLKLESIISGIEYTVPAEEGPAEEGPAGEEPAVEETAGEAAPEE